MLRLSLRAIRQHPARFALTTFAVVLGVGFVVGAFVVTDTVRTAVGGLFTDISAGVDVSVRARSNLEAGAQGGPASRGRIPDTVLATVLGVDGVEAAQGSVSSSSRLTADELSPGGVLMTTPQPATCAAQARANTS